MVADDHDLAEYDREAALHERAAERGVLVRILSRGQRARDDQATIANPTATPRRAGPASLKNRSTNKISSGEIATTNHGNSARLVRRDREISEH